MKKIFISVNIGDKYATSLRDQGQIVSMWKYDTPMPRAELLNAVKDCNALVCTLNDKIDEELLQHAPQLEVVSNIAVGYDNIDLSALKKHSIVAANTPDVLTQATAEMTLALLLSCARQIPYHMEQIRAGKWESWRPFSPLGLELKGKTLGLFGAGRIATRFAYLARPLLEAEILYHSRSRKPEFENTCHARYVSFDELLKNSQILSLHTDLNPQTYHRLRELELRQLPPDAILLNTARGPIIHEPDLIKVLQAGHLAAVGLDVSDPEPMAPDNPLLNFPRVVVSPHLGSATAPTRHAMVELALQNAHELLSGQTCANRIN